MKMLKKLALIAVLLLSGFASHAITNTAIAVSGTNIVLSWPSYGYEIYLVQSRQTLDPSDTWSTLTNAYPANSTNRTTLTVYGVVPPPATNGGGSYGTNIGGGPPSPNFASSSIMARSTEPLVMPANGSGGAVPLALYPPGFDLSGFTIFDPLTGESVSGAGYAVRPLSLDNPQPLDSGSGDPPPVTTGFFRVFHIPNFPAGITNYTFDGPTFIPVDYASPDADPNYVDSTTVLINGQPTDYAEFMPYVINGVTNWGVGIYFDRFPNGTSTIQLLTTVRQSDTLNDQTPYIVFSNAPATITIGNLITFTNWDDLIWNNTNTTFNAQSSVSNVDWEIDIYDVYGDFVNYQTGHSSDGNIAWTWNLVDYWNNPRNNPDADPVFYSYTTITGDLTGFAQTNGAQPEDNSSAGTWNPPKAASFPSVGAWMIAYMDNEFADAGPTYSGYDSLYKATMNGLAGGPELWEIPATTYPVKFGTNYTQAGRDGSWTNLANLLADPQYRNFYYHGHGGPDNIGGDIETFDTNGFPNGSDYFPGSKARLRSGDVASHITFLNPLGECFYRFVFLDGCNTANGGWPIAWGMHAVTNNLSYYTSTNTNPSHARPSAFVGWNTEAGGNGWGTVENALKFRSYWMANWSVQNGQEGDELAPVLEQARDGSNWVGPDKLWGALRVYGFRVLKFNEYNHQGDWH